jgi:hypothetical protein
MIDQAICEFKSMEIVGSESGDQFFEKFGIGNIVEYTDKPFERFSYYENLLSSMQKVDPLKYKDIHKGTPFYFLAWTAFDMKNFEKALFYMDAAISEDIRKEPQDWINCHAASFLTFVPQTFQSASRVMPILQNLVEAQISLFNNIPGHPVVSFENFIENFVRFLVRDSPKRSIITAFYTFLLEFEDLCVTLELRSVNGGSIEPFLTHLFKGGLIFESLLKNFYPFNDDGRRALTLSAIFKNTNFRSDFFSDINLSPHSLDEIVHEIQPGDFKSAFVTTANIRNTVGHNLVWDDMFNFDNYRLLFQQQVDAILYIVSKKFL